MKTTLEHLFEAVDKQREYLENELINARSKKYKKYVEKELQNLGRIHEILCS